MGSVQSAEFIEASSSSTAVVVALTFGGQHLCCQWYPRQKSGQAGTEPYAWLKRWLSRGCKSTTRAISGAFIYDAGEILLDGKPINFRSLVGCSSAQHRDGLQNLAHRLHFRSQTICFWAVSSDRPAVSANCSVDRKKMETLARRKTQQSGLMTSGQFLRRRGAGSGGQQRGVAVAARAAAFGSW
jgi:hypothetical protein